jgi:hypothetical protein
MEDKMAVKDTLVKHKQGSNTFLIVYNVLPEGMLKQKHNADLRN